MVLDLKGELAAKQLEDVNKFKYRQEKLMLYELSLRSLFTTSLPTCKPRHPHSTRTVPMRPEERVLQPYDLAGERAGIDRQRQDHRRQQLSPHGAAYYTPHPDEGVLTLVFESRFESGNLALALKLSDNEWCSRTTSTPRATLSGFSSGLATRGKASLCALTC
jgi:hypothetical protein